MTAILRRLPFSERQDEVNIGLERVRVRPYQIVIWISVTARTVLDLPPHAPRLPAILDTGHTHHFLLQYRHLAEWAQLSPAQLPQRATITVDGQPVPLHAATVWLHANQPGHRDHFRDVPPLPLHLVEGVAVSPQGSTFPRLPLLGLRALVGNRLHFTLDPERCVIHLRTPDWRTRLIQWLA
jgi:hypothetical protein